MGYLHIHENVFAFCPPLLSCWHRPPILTTTAGRVDVSCHVPVLHLPPPLLAQAASSSSHHCLDHPLTRPLLSGTNDPPTPVTPSPPGSLVTLWLISLSLSPGRSRLSLDGHAMARPPVYASTQHFVFSVWNQPMPGFSFMQLIKYFSISHY